MVSGGLFNLLRRHSHIPELSCNSLCFFSSTLLMAFLATFLLKTFSNSLDILHALKDAEDVNSLESQLPHYPYQS